MQYFTASDCSHNAFSRWELIVSVAAISILGFVTLPLLGSSRNRSERLFCLENLRQIGQGIELWAIDHGDSVPWVLYTSDGGTRPQAGIKPASASREFSVFSNEFKMPKILVCPNDSRRGVTPAENWGTSPQGGYMNGSYRDNATSYTISLHAFFFVPRAILSSDRGLKVDAGGAQCAYGVNSAASIYLSGYPGGSQVAWTNAFHGTIGNLLFRDGSVAETPNSALKAAWAGEALPDVSTAHLLIP